MTNLTEQALAKLKSEGHPYNVAAVWIGEGGGGEGLDGVAWRLQVTDGNVSGDLVVILSGTQGGAPGMEVDARALERAVERRAVNFPAESRARDVLAASPLRLRADELHDDASD